MPEAVTEAEFQLLLQRYLDGHCTPQERAVVERWYDRLDEMEGLQLPGQNQEAVEDAIWNRLATQNIPVAADTKVVQHPATWWQTPTLRVAAALVLMAVVLGLLWPTVRRTWTPAPPIATTIANGWTQQINTAQCPYGLRLPDGSRVTLHPGSSLRYPTALAGPRREVHLVGEAYFQVSKNPNRPFLVLTNQVVTTVLGTSFRVKAYRNAAHASVAVREGKVSVQTSANADLSATPKHPAATGVLLLPNQQAVYSANEPQLKKELVPQPAVLAPQPFEFEERPVAEVLTALEKAYGVDIMYDRATLAHCTVSITFYDEPLFEKLNLLCKSLGASYTLSTDAQILLHSKGCQTVPAS
ncbi:FecR domain-containing protein [Hymenobacter aerilatus]|uniref:FecR domain-containing protein n=1 Tax=Hymenobacter aerilatus TaxID=2932251 RepID=A0A8T9SYY0_9BACT|nr:FecR family protein [Hymenobacter aerilatus]UOR06601.1 FecR domain-containing protein [Hymenobacter aerilatus]